ncbi:lasso peptide biosynthesis B2 protein [Mucilaginibacter sp. HMF5004]|uniref:lasso peptide biosynthesis B2 protein n=1 Tax=Mucilaginibacter rivuli TaxID=2857527 RepID=UPI001C5EF0A0|nr:lasso peptide biosynthesis B2 protein [Mucilaginibacter rivuli]MBW4890012.1 lasso peptide biosynthesis B2 protein [Mucilaginibacter rivuli]
MKKRPAKEQLLFAEAWCFLATARFMLVFFPFKKISPLFGKLHATEAFGNDTLSLLVKTALGRACCYSPWRTKCFEQALAAKMMLKRRGVISTMFFGVYKDTVTNKLNAHAWLKSGDKIVTGGGNLERYTVLSSFTS